jgi:FkbM family methyltransferase
MKKVFIDCGGNKGQGLRQFIGMFNIDSSWEVESYEPNPDCELEKNVSEYDFVKPFTKAVWTHDGKISFSKTITNQRSNFESVGSSVNGLNWYDTKYFDQEVIEVDCVDISSILGRYSSEDFIVVKLDIEGAEFEVVRKMLSDGSIKKIDELYVEWHTCHVESETEESEKELKEKIESFGVKLHSWY